MSSSFLTAFFIVILMIAIISFFACIVPVVQYIYCRFIKKDPCPIKYYFSEHLFDRHMSHDVGLNDVRVINNRTELSKLWEVEIAHDLP